MRKDIKNSAPTLGSVSETEYSVCSQLHTQSSALAEERREKDFHLVPGLRKAKSLENHNCPVLA